MRRLGFAVDLVIDPDRNAMESSIRNLGRKAESRAEYERALALAVRATSVR